MTHGTEEWIGICNLKARSHRLLDTKRWEDWADLFTDDLVLDTSQAGGPPPIAGRAQAVAMVRRTRENARTVHQVHAPDIEITQDHAEGIWAMQDRLVFPDGTSLIGYGHYTETCAKRDGVWKIARTALSRLHPDMVPS